MLAVLLVLGSAGYLEELNAAVAHHVLHIVFPTLAFVLFAIFVANDVRKHGWPVFTWRLDPPRTVR
jgi:hypothetical protein